MKINLNEDFNAFNKLSLFEAEDEEVDTTFGDVDDIQLTGDVEEDFNTLINTLQNNSFEELGDELNDVVNDPKLYDLLAMGFGDGELADVKMSSSPTALYVTSLLPSQSEIGLDNSLSYPLKQDCSHLFDDKPIKIVAPIVTYRKTFIVDGHHRWSQLYMINPNAKIEAINFNYDQPSPYRALRNFQGAIAVANKDVPKSYSKVNNVYDMSKDQIKSYVDKNIQDVCWKSLVEVGVCEDRESAIEYITNNALTLKRDNFPPTNAPDREYMPQTDDKSIEVAKKGQTNI